MRLPKFLFFLIILHLIAFQTHAQSDFRDAFIITNSNDTVQGLINYRGNSSNAKRCVFKKDSTSSSRVFAPTDINGYRFINGKYYISKTIKSENSEEMLFLEYLVNGEIDIYYYRDQDGEYYFVDTGNGKLNELKIEEEVIYRNNKRYVEKSKKYIGVLKYAFQASPTVFRKAENVKLNHKSLIKITEDYHQEVCPDKECIIYQKALPSRINRLGFLTGVTVLTSFEINGTSDEYQYLNNYQSETSIYPSLGLFYKMNLPFVNERLYLQYELSYKRIRSKATSNYTEAYLGVRYDHHYSITRQTINNSAYLRYEGPTGKLRPTFHIGAFLNYSIHNDYQERLEATFVSGNPYFTEESTDNPFSKIDYGPGIGFGLSAFVFNKKQLFADFSYLRGLGNHESIHSNYFLLKVGLQLTSDK